MIEYPELTWAVILMAVGLGLVVMELFIPSGGIIGFFAMLAILGSIVLAFRNDTRVGAGFLFFAVIAFPAISVLALRWWPYTPMGRRILSQLPEADEMLPRYEGLQDLVDSVGTAKSLMMPSGSVLINGRTIDAVSEGMPIEPGQAIRVIQVRGNQVVVRPTGQQPNRAEADRAASSSDDILSRPADTLGIEPLDDPLA